jgi:hypothetical protein
VLLPSPINTGVNFKSCHSHWKFSFLFTLNAQPVRWSENSFGPWSVVCCSFVNLCLTPSRFLRASCLPAVHSITICLAFYFLVWECIIKLQLDFNSVARPTRLQFCGQILAALPCQDLTPSQPKNSYILWTRKVTHLLLFRWLLLILKLHYRLKMNWDEILYHVKIKTFNAKVWGCRRRVLTCLFLPY